jgi:hypothetical protein
LGLPSSAAAQAKMITNVIRLEIDQKPSKKAFKVLFRVNGHWQEAEREGNSFTVPPELVAEEAFDLLILVDNKRLNFSAVHKSKFSTDWIIGIDNKPFAEGFIEPEDVDKTKFVYYIIFENSKGLDTRLVVRESSVRRRLGMYWDRRTTV